LAGYKIKTYSQKFKSFLILNSSNTLFSKIEKDEKKLYWISIRDTNKEDKTVILNW